MAYTGINGRISYKHYSLVKDLSDSDISNLERQISIWESENPISEFTEHPQMLSWVIILMGCGALASYEGLWNAPPVYLLSWLVLAMASYIYFKNKRSVWYSKREYFEINIIEDLKTTD
jgi:hypothetical protein